MRIDRWICCLVTLIMVMLSVGQSHSGNAVDLSKGQTVYVSVYSHIYRGPRMRSLDLTATLSIRNTDPAESLDLTSVTYFDSDGKLVRKYLEKPQTIGPLATTQFIVEDNATTGESGTKFLVQWQSLRPVTPPVLECLMITTQSGLGISFVTHGRVIKDVGK